MNKSICLLEFKNISSAFAVLNELLLEFPVNLFLNRRMCPGRYIILLEGNENDVEECVKYLISKKNIYAKPLHSISCEVINALKRKSLPEFDACIGVFEFTHAIDAIKMADLGIKKEGVTINKIDFSIGLFGKGLLLCSGTNAQLYNFKNFVLNSLTSKDIVGLEVISRPCQELIDLL